MNCNHNCNQGRTCDCADKPVPTFEVVMNYVISLLAGVGVIAFIVAIGFWSAI